MAKVALILTKSTMLYVFASERRSDVIATSSCVHVQRHLHVVVLIVTWWEESASDVIVVLRLPVVDGVTCV